MVQLKVSGGALVSVAFVKFQFHYGTIKSRFAYVGCYEASMFQFHYGTIKRQIYLLMEAVKSCFNSIMVQLKAGTIANRVSASLFQFHYGTIKSSPFKEYSNFYKVSIPLWYN